MYVNTIDQLITIAFFCPYNHEWNFQCSEFMFDTLTIFATNIPGYILFPIFYFEYCSNISF